MSPGSDILEWVMHPGLAAFCQTVEKNGFFGGKNRTGKNSFCRQK